jgi:hypothetical protein
MSDPRAWPVARDGPRFVGSNVHVLGVKWQFPTLSALAVSIVSCGVRRALAVCSRRI